jgi:hypothetical protein
MLCKVKKGLYVDGHERPDVVESWSRYIQQMEELDRLVQSQT